jgi:hypothetical protein
MTMHKLGTLTPIIYFVAHRDPRGRPEGHIILAPYSDCPTPPGYSREYEDTLAGIDRLQTRLNAQTAREFAREHEAFYGAEDLIRAEVADRLYARLCSSATSEFEKDYIRAYLQLRIDKREKHRRNFECRAAFLYAREMDLGKRRADEESFNVERHEVKE